ncbi:MAG: amino acid ABC transporter substrate-binding protein [Deltaproteobacteria bacterium]|nr:amino acid ABC transporter substrate-binding protein [Deltaproteobacteria bacterium]
MTQAHRCGAIRRPGIAVLGLLSLLLGAPGAFATPERSHEETLRLGERMYREGLLPSGEPMQAFVSGDVPAPGTSFTCVSCHLRSGLGSIEGQVVTPPTNGRILYQERKSYQRGSVYDPLIHSYSVYLPVRPAYTDQTLADLILNGVDPTGRSVVTVMPRYEIDDADMAILIAYLKALSDKPSPGVGDQEIKFATVIVEGTDPVAVASMLAPLQFNVDRKNSLAKAAKGNRRIGLDSYNMLGALATESFTFSRWTLKGPPETWRAQLDAYYRAEPVFALLGGISEGTWEPVHRFCEDNKIPDLLPAVEYPVLSDTDWYTLYPSRGVRQEGESAARYLHGMVELFAGRKIVQIIRAGRRGETLAEGFREEWSAAGHLAAVDVTLAEGEPLTAERLRQLVAQEKPAALVVWDGPAALEPLASLVGNAEGPKLVLASGTTLGKALWTIPEPLRSLLYLTYPYRLPQEDVRFDAVVKRVLPGKKLDAFDPRVLRQSYLAGELLGKALREMRGEYYRDFLLDTIGMMADMYYPLYERVSFGPGQRYASKGCFIVQLGKGEKPQLERRSEWAAH